MENNFKHNNPDTVRNLNVADYRILISEWNALLKNSRISKIFSYSKGEMIWLLYNNKLNHYLMFSPSMPGSRIHLLADKPHGKPIPNNIIEYARKHIINGMIMEFSLLNYDRCIKIVIQKEVTTILFVEMMSARGRYIFCDENNIVMYSSDAKFLREMKGKSYSFPENNHAFDIDQSFDSYADKLYNQIVDEYFNKKQTEPTSCKDKISVEFVLKLLRKEIKKITKLKSNIEKDIEKYKNHDQFELFGNLILINKDKISKGQQNVFVENVFESPPAKIEIPLDPSLSAVENSTSYIKKANKARKGIKILNSRISEVSNKLETLVQTESELNKSGNDDLAESLFEKYFARKNVNFKSKGKKSPEKRNFKEIVLNSENKVFIGRNSRENMYLFNKVSRGNDYWFHCRDAPGGHIYYRPGDRSSISQQMIHDLAVLSVHYSKLKGQKGIEVIFSRRKYLSRTRNMPPGMVSVAKSKTIKVDYSKEIISSFH